MSTGAPSDGSPSPSGLRGLFVHAHPDDESIETGATLAAAAAAGHAVTLLTANRGEAGEVYPEELAQLRTDPDALGGVRVRELAEATARLGVSDHRFLQPPPGQRWVDSGMAGEPAASEPRPGAHPRWVPFADVDLLVAARRVAATVREVRPHVVVTYDEVGGYGHPDHVAVHRATMYGLLLAGAASFAPGDGATWDVPKVYWVAGPRSRTLAGLAAGAAAVADGRAAGLRAHPWPDTAPVVPDDAVTTVVAAGRHARAKADAMTAHRTQLVVVRGALVRSPTPPFGASPTSPAAAGTEPADLYALTNRIARPVDAVECYRLIRGTPITGSSGWEEDLFAGLDDHRVG